MVGYQNVMWRWEISFGQSALTDGAQSRTFGEPDYLLANYVQYPAIKRDCRCLLSENQIKLLVPPHKLRGDADPGVTVQQLEKAIGTFITEADMHRDLVSIFRDMELAGGWDTAPSRFVDPIAKLKRFYKLVFGVCRNGLLPQKMLETALKNLENYYGEQGARIYHWNFTQRSLDAAALRLGTTMRIGARKLRDLASNSKIMHISLSGASGETCECIREICDMLQIPRCETCTPAFRGGVAPTLSPEAPLAEGHANVKRELDIDEDLSDCNWDIFEKALRGDFGRVPLVRRTSNVGSTATCSTSLNPMDGYPGRPTPPSVPPPAPSDLTEAPTPMKLHRSCDPGNLMMVEFGKPSANLARALSFGMEAVTTPPPKRSSHGAIASDLPSGDKVLEPGDAGTDLFSVGSPGAAVAQTIVELGGLKLDPKNPVQATRRDKPKKAGGPVQRANVKQADVPVQPTVQRKKTADGPVKLKLTKVIASSQSTHPMPIMQLKQPRHSYACRAYRKAMRQGKTDGKDMEQRRVGARAAYQKAGREFDKMRSSGYFST